MFGEGKARVMDRLTYTIYWSDPDETYLCDVQELPGCRADGEMPSQALSHAMDCADSWIEKHIELERPCWLKFGDANILVNIYKSGEGGYRADCPCCPGVVTQGGTVCEVFANLREAIRGYIDSPGRG